MGGIASSSGGCRIVPEAQRPSLVKGENTPLASRSFRGARGRAPSLSGVPRPRVSRAKISVSATTPVTD
jgi:hypothetical protein